MKKLFVIIFLLTCLKGFSTRYYINGDSTGLHAGSDSYSTTQAQDSATPWLHLSKLNDIFSSLVAGDSVLLKRGTTFITTTGIIIRKSGNFGNDIIIAAYGTGQKPIVTGLKPLTFVAATQSNTWRSVEQLGVSYLNCVVINGVMTQMGRWPKLARGKEGWNTIVDTSRVPGDEDITVTTGAELTGMPTIYAGSELVCKTRRFWIERYVIKSYNGSDKIEYTNPTGTAKPTNYPSIQFGWFIQNDSNTLTTSGTNNLPVNGEWWYSTVNKKLKVYSNSGAPTGVQAAVAENLVTFYSTSSFNYVTFLNISFQGSNSDIVLIDGGTGIKFKNCVINNSGRNGINTASDRTQILSDSITNCASKGVVFNSGGDRAIVDGNYLRGFHQLLGMGNGSREDGGANHSGVGIYIVRGGFTSVSNNLVVLCGYTGIHFKTQDSVIIKYNTVDSVCNVMDDGGAYYSYSNNPNSNAKRRKFLKNIALNGVGNTFGRPVASNATGEGVAGIYMDLQSNDMDVDSNTVINFTQGIFVNFGGSRINIRDNYTWDNSRGIQINTRSADITRNLVITGNTFYCIDATDTAFHMEGQGDTLALFGTIDNNFYTRPLGETKTMSWKGTGVNVKLTDLATFKATSWIPYDNNSSVSGYTFASPASQSAAVVFAYNPTSVTMSAASTNIYKDIKGVTYSGGYTLKGHEGRVFFLQGTIPPNPPTPGTNIIKLRGLRPIPN